MISAAFMALGRSCEEAERGEKGGRRKREINTLTIAHVGCFYYHIAACTSPKVYRYNRPNKLQ